jgi:hypothetical protein
MGKCNENWVNQARSDWLPHFEPTNERSRSTGSSHLAFFLLVVVFLCFVDKNEEETKIIGKK